MGKLSIVEKLCFLATAEAERAKMLPFGSAFSIAEPDDNEKQIATIIFNEAYKYELENSHDEIPQVIWSIPLHWAFYAGMGCAYAWAKGKLERGDADLAIKYLTKVGGVFAMDDFVFSLLRMPKKEIKEFRQKSMLSIVLPIIKEISKHLDNNSQDGDEVYTESELLNAGAQAMFSVGVFYAINNLI